MTTTTEDGLLINEIGYRAPAQVSENTQTDNWIGCIRHEDVQASDVTVTTTEGYEFLVSYNWKKSSDTPTIFVPGTPRRWSPPQLPIQLRKGFFDIRREDVGAYRFEPIFQALATMESGVKFNNIDIVANRESLGLLFKIACDIKKYPEFALDLNLVNKTLFFTKRQKQDDGPVLHTRFYGFEVEFKEKFTSKGSDMSGADWHYRVIKYAIGNLNVVVRAEATCQFDGPPIQDESKALHEIRSNSLQSKMFWSAPAIPGNMPRTNVICQGDWIPHNSTADIKHNTERFLKKEEMWFGRIGHGILGNHEFGRVEALESVIWGAKEFEAWAVENQQGLCRLAWMLERIRKTVAERADGAAVLLAGGHGKPLKIFEATSDGVLGMEIIEHFWV